MALASTLSPGSSPWPLGPRRRAGGCSAARQLPKDLPPWSTVYRWFTAWRDACVFKKINHMLVMLDRERVEREAGGRRGYDPGTKIKGRKRHALVDID